MFPNVRLVCLLAFLQMSAGSEDTQITFSSLTEDDFTAFGDVAYNPVNRSYIMNAGSRMNSSGTCGELVYKKRVRIQDVATGGVTSFSTSFSFKFTTHGLRAGNRTKTKSRNPSQTGSSGYVFAIVQSEMQPTLQELVSQSGYARSCKRIQNELQPGIYSTFSLAIDTDYNPTHNEPSNNMIRIPNNVDFEYDVPSYTYNLCGHTTRCSYFSSGGVFTAWIDFSSSSQTLEVRLANGSNPYVTKPLQPLLQIPNFKMSKVVLGDEVFLTFWGTSDANNAREYELLSWSFFSSGVPKAKISSSRMLLHFSKGRTWIDIAVGVFGTVVALVILWFMSRFGTPVGDYHRYTALDFPNGQRVFSYSELRKATENFDKRNLLGSGGSGSVYRGSLDGTWVAVKHINFAESEMAEAVFRAEIGSLCQIRHRNVVQLQGWCQEKGRPLLLVYDCMPNGGLNEWLHKSGRHFQHQVLSLEMRHSILEGVGAALEYLHEDCENCVLHRDIKSSNVLLDADFKAHLADFGLARWMDHHKVEKTTLAAGTLGYMAPEMPYTGKATTESDVYSFGILVLEVVCGRRPLDLQRVEPEDLVLLYTVWRAHESRSLLKMVDLRLLPSLLPPRSIPHQDGEPIHTNFCNLIDGNIPKSTLVNVNIEVHEAMVVNLLKLGLLCCLPNPKTRPSMRQVNEILQQIRDMENKSIINTISMLALPTTKPLGLYHSLEFSQIALSSTSNSPSSSLAVHIHPRGNI